MTRATEWNPRDHIGTAPIYSTNPITVTFHGRSKRLGTRYFYLKHWPDCLGERGFRMRKKFADFIEEPSS